MTEKIVDVNLIEYGSYSALVAVTESRGLLIAQPTVEILMGWRENSGREKIVSKSLKDFAGKDYKVGKTSYSVSWVGQGKTVFYDYSDFLILMRWQVKQGNESAINLVVAGFADSFSDFAYKAFGISLTEKQRKQLLEDRQKGIVRRHSLTDSIKKYLISHPGEDNRLYAIATDMIYLGIFNRRAAKLKADWDSKNPRDNMTSHELFYVAEVEALTSRLIDLDNLPPLVAVKQALARLIIPVCDR